MKPITKEHRNYMNLILNELAFKEYIMSYGQHELVKKLYHGKYVGIATPRRKVENYTDEEAVEMNEITKLWKEYNEGEYDHLLPENLKGFKQALSRGHKI